ncbi:MAG: enoyl-CoA hydratase-related protein, partial [Roseitalea porphyridii]
MTQQVQQRVQDGIAVLTLGRPPGNALVPALRADLLAALQTALADPGIRAVVLHGAGSGFCAGLDLNEFGDDEGGPRLPLNDLFATIEDAPKPVVAALHGAALGAGVELALAAHARVAQRGTRISMPEVTLGLIPGGGATQRLPRLAGAQASLELMLSGRAVEVTDPRLAPVFARITEDDPRPAARELAASLADGAAWTRTRDVTRGLSDPAAFQAAVGNVAARMRAGGSAEADILACVEAAQLLPFEQGLIFEQSRHDARLALPETRAIRHAFTAERRAASLPKTAAGDVPVIRTVAVTGTGPRLAGLAALCLASDMDVMLLTATPKQAAGVRHSLQAALAEAVEAGRMDPGARDDQLARLLTLEGPGGLARADLVLDTGTPGFERPMALPSSLIWGLLDDATDGPGRAREAGAAGRLLRLRLPTGGPAARLA